MSESLFRVCYPCCLAKSQRRVNGLNSCPNKYQFAQTNNDNTLLTEFFDSTTPNITTLPSLSDSSFQEGYTPDLTLAEWFKRPVKIKTYNWIEGTSIFDEFDPWSLYFSNSEILAKLKGFSRMQATLHIKLTVNASPYQYGVGIVSYKPFGTQQDSFAGGGFDAALTGSTAGGTVPGNLMVKTCRPNVMFYPQFSKGCEMILPFHYYKNWINLDTALTEIKNLGRLNIYTPVNLNTTGATTVNPVSVTIFAWCEMHKVSGPSFTMQSGDEYADRPVSTTMSALSTVARSVSMVPSLRPYAMATSSVLSSLGGAARWFGYSNPPVISDIHAMRPNYMASFASPEVCVQHEKLALDPKNEVTVDSRTVGLDGVDHMAIAHIVGRDVYFGVSSWSATAIATSPLALINVSPMVYTSSTSSGSVTTLGVKSIQMTPGCQIGTLFDLWHGPIRYKFSAIASQFHRGRLLVSYDPDGFQNTYTSTAYTGPRTISKVWDITENPTFEFEVPYMAPTSFLKTGGLVGVTTAATSQSLIYLNPTLPGSWGYSDGNHNGSIIVSVLNALTSGNTTAGVSILCAVNCSGVEYANPRELEIPFSFVGNASGSNTIFLQGGEDAIAEDPDTVQVATVPTYVQPVQHTIYTGEIVRSIRTLMHRTNLYMRTSTMSDAQAPVSAYSGVLPTIVVASTAASSTPQQIRQYNSSLILPQLPFPPGATSSTRVGGVMIKNGTSTDVTGNSVTGTYIGVPTTTAYLAASYSGWRGSSVYHVRKFDQPDYANSTVPFGIISDMSISRSFRSFFRMLTGFTFRTPFIWRTFAKGDVTQTTTTLGALQYFNQLKSGIAFATGGHSGMAVTNPTKVDVIDAVIPWYSNLRMYPANPFANLQATYSFNDLSWNVFDENAENVGNAVAILNTTVMFPDDCPNTIENLARHPVLDIYHKAGVDFTCFWYLNPPAIQVYYGKTDGYPVGWT